MVDKILKITHPTEVNIFQFCNEMLKLSIFNHKNVLNFVTFSASVEVII